MESKLTRTADKADPPLSALLMSAVWDLPAQARLLWITMVAMRDHAGVVDASIFALAHRARMSVADTEVALAQLLKPDPYAHPSGRDFRTIREVDGVGWRFVSECYGSPEVSSAARVIKTYMIEAMGTSPPLIKIGRSWNPKNRLHQLQENSPVDLRLRWSEDRDRERELHQRFAADRVRREWFLFSENIRSFLRREGA